MNGGGLSISGKSAQEPRGHHPNPADVTENAIEDVIDAANGDAKRVLRRATEIMAHRTQHKLSRAPRRTINP